MIKSEAFTMELQDLAKFARALSHPARLAILQYLSDTKVCISGDISDQLPLSRSTVSQHLKELKEMGLIHGEIDGLKINYCLCAPGIKKLKEQMKGFLDSLEAQHDQCC